MSYIGMLALGVFVGSVITLGIINTKDWSKLHGLFITILGAALGGTVFGFIEWLGKGRLGDSIFFYPLGLVLGMMWVYSKGAAEHIRKGHKLLGWAHIAGMLLLTVFTLAVMFSPSIRSRLPSTEPLVEQGDADQPPAHGEYKSE